MDALIRLATETAALVLEKQAAFRIPPGLAKGLGGTALGLGAVGTTQRLVPDKPVAVTNAQHAEYYAGRYQDAVSRQAQRILSAVRAGNTDEAQAGLKAFQSGNYGGTGNTGLTSWLMPWTYQRGTPNAAALQQQGQTAVRGLTAEYAPLVQMVKDPRTPPSVRQQLAEHLGRLTGQASQYGQVLGMPEHQAPKTSPFEFNAPAPSLPPGAWQ